MRHFCSLEPNNHSLERCKAVEKSCSGCKQPATRSPGSYTHTTPIQWFLSFPLLPCIKQKNYHHGKRHYKRQQRRQSQRGRALAGKGHGATEGPPTTRGQHHDGASTGRSGPAANCFHRYNQASYWRLIHARVLVPEQRHASTRRQASTGRRPQHEPAISW